MTACPKAATTDTEPPPGDCRSAWQDAFTISGEPKMTIAGDTDSYLRFCTRQNVDRYFHQLEGVLQGILMDGVVSAGEAETLKAWAQSLGPEAHRAPFGEVVEALEDILADGIVDEEEVKDLIWLARRFTTKNDFYDAVTADIQRLHGIINGFLSDGKLTDGEVRALFDWLEEHENLRRAHPYEELCTLLTLVLSDGVIDEQERRLLREFLADLAPSAEQGVIQYDGIDLGSMTLPLVCATNVDVKIEGAKFCFTGRSVRGLRSDFQSTIEGIGGSFTDRLSQDIDYLVVGDKGNPCWAFARYGRKIEKALRMRREGSLLLIIKEADFWDAVEDYL